MIARQSFAGAQLTASYTDKNGGSEQENNISGRRGSWNHYHYTIPAGMKELRVTTTGGGSNEDADLYVRFGREATKRVRDCRSNRSRNEETCVIKNPKAGKWYFGIYAFESYNGVTLNVEWTP